MKKRSNPKVEAMRERSLMVESERQNYNRKYSLNEQTMDNPMNHPTTSGEHTPWELPPVEDIVVDLLDDVQHNLKIKGMKLMDESLISCLTKSLSEVNGIIMIDELGFNGNWVSDVQDAIAECVEEPGYANELYERIEGVEKLLRMYYSKEHREKGYYDTTHGKAFDQLEEK